MRTNPRLIDPLSGFMLTGRNQAVVEWAFARLPNSGTLCDLGCGYGWLAESISMRVPQATIVGIDQDETAIGIAVSNSKSHARFVTSRDIDQEEWQSFFDVSIATETIEHVASSEREQFLKQMYQTLKPGGIGLITTPSSNLLSRVFDPAHFLAGHHHFKLSEIKNLIIDAGFRINHISKRGRWWEVISLWDLYASKWIFQRRPILTRFIARKLNEEWLCDDRGWVCWWIEVERP